MIGKQLGAYKITEEIGSGGMATVYRAYQASMDRHVAVKVIHSHILHQKLLKDRFQREARLIAKLEHPHLLPVYDFDGDHEPPYIVMRYLEGGTLKQILENGTLPHGEVLYMLQQIATALDYAHRQGVVHRDLKPSNIMIDREGNAFVTDFGIARASGTHEDLTGTGVLIGTPGYMSPEQARGETDVDQTSDVYALGAMVFEILTGTPPFHHESGLGVLMAHINEEVPQPSDRNGNLPREVDPVVRKAMAKEKKERYSTAEAFMTDLTAALRVNSAAAPEQLRSMTQTFSIEQFKAFQEKANAAKEESRSTPVETPTDQQRQMTGVHFDVTELAELLYETGADAETVRNRMDALWKKLGAVVEEHGGAIQNRSNELGVALWGRSRAREDDPEQAIRAALLLREAVREEALKILGKDWEPSEENPLPFVAGITTGPVLLERRSDTGSYTASGATITLGARLKEGAPPGGILVTHETFTLVRGIFQFHSHEPLRLRGRKEPLDVYLATKVKPRSFRLEARGIEGIETRMIGREIELRLLQEAFTLTIEDGETQVVTVVGEAGIGKSRLLFEFFQWSELQEEVFWLFQARATEPSMLQPYSLTRDLFSARFQILESDPLDKVHEKFVKGVTSFLGEGSEEKAHLIGQLVGFDFSGVPAVAEALRDTDGFRHRALEHLGEFFTTATKAHPVMIHLEDIHWADDRSLDLINNLVRENDRLPLFVICMARPGLYERRPQWGEGQRFHERVLLEPLSQLSSRRLVKELLKKVEEVPSDLRDLIVERADGNPFYIEELIKALIDDRVIVKGEEAWSVDASRMSSVRIPPTLTGVLQSRLDTLPQPLHQLMQRVSVVGRIFWDAAAVHLSREDGLDADQVRDMLDDLRQREMILRREESVFAGTTEYVFRHAILRDVTYQTLVPRQRRALHKQTGDWLLEMGGDRAREHTLLVAEHYGSAGEPVLAAEQFLRAGQSATTLGAYSEAEATLKRGRAQVTGAEHEKTRLEIDLALAESQSMRGAHDAARKLLESLLPAARKLESPLVLVDALGKLARITIWQEDLDASQEYLDEALPLVREMGDGPALVFILRQMGNLHVGEPEEARPYLEESRDLARKLGDRMGEATALNSLGNVAQFEGDYERARKLYEKTLAYAREEGNRFTEGMAIENIGATYLHAGDLEMAETKLKEALTKAREIGEEYGVATIQEFLGWVSLEKGNSDEARKRLLESLVYYRKIGMKPFTLLVLFSVLETRTGDRNRALAWMGLARHNRTSHQIDLIRALNRFLPVVTEGLSEAEAEATMAGGKELELEEVLGEIEGQ